MKNIILAQVGGRPIPSFPSGSGGDNFSDFIFTIIDSVLDPIVFLVVSIAVIYFIWGVVKYIDKSGKDEDRAAGRQMMVYGIVAIFVMVSVWGLVNVIVNTFNLSPTPPDPPQLLKN